MSQKFLLYSLTLSICIHNSLYSEGIVIPSEDTYQKLSYLNFPDHLDFPLTLINQSLGKNHGLMHNAIADVTISNDKHSQVFVYQSNVTNGGVISCRSCSLVNNTQPIFFGNNRATNNGGAICSTENVTVSKNSRVIFYQNNAFNQKSAPGNGAGGAVFAKNFEATYNNREALFISNLTKTNGGAISSLETCKFLNNTASIHFDNNRGYSVDGLGGAIYAKSCEFAHNTGEITFTVNKCGKGGAIYSTTSTSITDNHAPITFFSNAACNGAVGANGNGGAINSPTITIENNKQSLIFDGNSAAHAGGALSYQNLTIQNNGPIYFFNNTSCWGGAFYGQAENGTTKISADYGDIIFNNNIAIDRHGVWRSAMYFSTNHVLSLGAASNQRVCLFDTLDTSYLTSFTINPEAKHTGAVVFSADQVQWDLATNVNKIQTSYTGEITVKHGILSVEAGARLSAYKITPEDNTHFCLGNNAVVKTQQKSNNEKDSNLQIKNVAILLTDVLKTDSIPPTIWIYPGGSGGNYTENTDARISISGSLSLWNENYSDPYDSLDLSQSIDRIPLLHLSEPTNNSITTTSFDIQTINSHQHYGYQGIWTPYWEEITVPSVTTSLDTTNPKHRYLYANWMPTGYTVNPQHRADLVANTLWQTAYKATAFYPSLMDNTTSSFHLQGEGLGIHTRQKDKNAILGFSSRSLGYSGECLLSSDTHHKFLLTFSQVIGKMKEHISKNKVASHNYLIHLSLQMPWFHEHLITTASLGYCYSDHHMQSFYPQNKKSETQFEDHALSARVGCYLYEKLSLLNHYFTPFIQLSGVRVEQTKINEIGDFPRSFSNQHPLIDIALPIGIQTSWIPKTHLPSFWEIQFAYQPSIYRQNPKILTTLLASNGSWISSGSSVARHSLHAEGRNSVYLFHNIVAFLNYQLDLSSSTTSHYINAGSRVVF
ncbi:hypothetical protein O1W69_00085 [Chlamydia sp. 12-01]|uniref:polymorphic outer membrane protein middle domain-containing protein n=1 Tax=Chlamydia sp. 12-01 TaxID=3002742 RepID=UPI0035D4E47F